MIGFARRRPAIELDDLERAARVTLQRLGERAPSGGEGEEGENARGTRVSLRIHPDELAAIGLPRKLVAGDLQRSLDEWAILELPCRTPVDVELVPDPSLGRKDVRVWLADGRERPAPEPEDAEADDALDESAAETAGSDPDRKASGGSGSVVEEGESEGTAQGDPKRDRIGAARRPRTRRRGYSAVATLAPRSNARRTRRNRFVALLAVLIVAVVWYLVGPAMADTYAAPGPAPDVVLADGSPATPEGGVGSWLPWVLGGGVVAAALAGLLALVAGALAALLRRKRSIRSPAAETFPATMAHRAVSEGTRERADAQADTVAMIGDLHQVRDGVGREAQDDALAIEQDLHWIRQKLAAAPAGRLAAERGGEVDALAGVDADQRASEALQALAEGLQELRRRARSVGGETVARELAALRQRADDVRGMVARRPALIID